MNDTIPEPIMAEFASVVRSFRIAFKLDNQQMLTVISEAAEMMKRAILVEKASKGALPADAVSLRQGAAMNDNWIGGHVWEHIPNAVPRGRKANRRKLSSYRDGKVAAHVTKGGVGLVGQLMGHNRKHKKGKL